RVRAVKVRRSVGRRETSAAAPEDTSRAIAEHSITLLKTEPSLLPVKRSQRVAVVTTSSEFARAARQLPEVYDVVRLVEKEGFELWTKDRKLSGDSMRRAEQSASAADVTIVAVINPWEMGVFEQVRQSGKKVVLVSLGRPILLHQGAQANALVATYGYSQASCVAATRVLAGELEARGRLPVSLPEYPFGTGLTLGGASLPGDGG
ncbi:MAG TPA: glycoside hydrolase family 3 C-terminal domain-containing protein, partial [Polyangiaceae bacterium]|nr:glycoside hydrolase family 3 C-terminal domain-containing protein [Polyangiaceae bacterium]